ncbi:unnamed protein product [Haemonchus placei]|uniref:DUF4329 domain-containing protein n=1 Tax=Haemonchus placei TaxID=6290 RepID=A0A0N4WIG7_HAEPC|nr:unnamed protein product [Haemonchus placei]
MSNRIEFPRDVEFTPGPSSPGSLFGQDWQERRAYVRPSDNIVVMLNERERGYTRNAMSEGMYRRVLSVLPFCGCHHSSSENPYLDPLYFSIDEKIHSNLMYGRMRFDLGPVKIFARRTQHHVCTLGLPPSLASKSPSCVILFHPQDPLAIAFDRIRTDQPLTFYLPSASED